MRQNYLFCNRQTSNSRKSIIGCRVLEIFHTISGNRYSRIELRKSIFANEKSIFKNRSSEIVNGKSIFVNDTHKSRFAQQSSEIDLRKSIFANGKSIFRNRSWEIDIGKSIFGNRYSQIDICTYSLPFQKEILPLQARKVCIHIHEVVSTYPSNNLYGCSV